MIGACIKTMFGGNGNSFTNVETNTIIINNIFFLIVAVVAATPLCRAAVTKLKSAAAGKDILFTYIYNALNVVIPVILLFLSTIALIGNSYNPFIYFRF